MSIQKRDLCGYFISGYCLKLQKNCDNVKPEDCPSTNELLELIRKK